MTRPYDRRLFAASKMVENLSFRMPEVREYIRRMIVSIDGYTTTASGRSVGATGERTIAVALLDDDDEPIVNADGVAQVDHVPITPVEASMLAKERWRAIGDDLDAHAAAIAIITVNVTRDLERIVSSRDAAPRCDGGVGRSGVDEWGRKDCWNVPALGRDEVPRKMCDACRKREHRWRVAHSLTGRLGEEGVA